MTLTTHKQHILSILANMNQTKGSQIPRGLKTLKETISEDSYKLLIYGNKKVSEYCTMIDELNCWSVKSILDYWKNVRLELDDETYQKMLIEL